MWRLCFLLAALSASVGLVVGYSNGKVFKSCADMEPKHGFDSSKKPPPYAITVDQATFGPGDNITVSLQADPSTYFRGFLIEVRDADKLAVTAGGVFHLTNPHHSRLLQCGQAQGSVVSHRNGDIKKLIQAVWQPPVSPPQRAQVLVTALRDYEEFWVGIPGPIVSLMSLTAAPTTSPAQTTTSPPQTTASPAQTTASPEPFTSAGCGHNKSCLRDPVGCQPESDPRCFFLSFSVDEAGQSVMFELSGPAEGYVSFALSLDKWMGNDDAYLCVSDGSSVTISPAYISGRQHPDLAVEDSLWGKAWSLADGVIQCSFHRNITLPNRFDLNMSYFLFLAHGRSDRGLIHRHKRQPLISSSQTVITGHPEDLDGSRSPLLVKFHGVLMLTVWMWLVSMAVLIARHYRHFWPDATLLGQKPWFQVHRTMMVLAVVLTSVAFILPFVYRRGWSKRAGAHAYIGCVVMALCVIQPIMAVVRPAPESPRRIIFNWLHFSAGTAVQLLAAACLFLGMEQQALLLSSPWSPAVLACWLLWIVLTDLLLLIYSCRPRNRGNDSDKEEILPTQSEAQTDAEVSFKKTVLVVFITANTAFLATFIKAIGDV